MTVWVDVCDKDWRRVGPGPLYAVHSVTAKRRLDEVGHVRIEASAVDPRTLEWLTIGRKVILYWMPPNDPAAVPPTRREIGRGIIRDLRISETASGPTLIADGPDAVEDLKLPSTLPNREYNNKAADEIAADLADLAAWKVRASPNLADVANNTALHFDGVSAWRALRKTAAAQGVHLRYLGRQLIEIGPLGEVLPLRFIQRSRVPATLYDNADVAIVESINVAHSSDQMCNVIFPYAESYATGSQFGLAASTRTAPYTKQTTTGPDGSTLYYLEDADSVQTYGAFQRVVTFENIGYGGTGSSIITNANALYDAAAAFLQRSRLPQVAYDITALKAWSRPVLPGDRVQLSYKGMAEQGSEYATYIDVDAPLWVLEASESVGVEGHTVSLTLSDVDRQLPTTVKQVADIVTLVERLARQA